MGNLDGDPALLSHHSVYPNRYDEDRDEPNAHIVVAPDQIGWGTSPKHDVSNINPRVRWVLELVGVEPLRSQSWPELRCGLAKPAGVRDHSLLAVTAD